MGIEYYLINKKDKTFYDLGKGGWYELNNDTEAFQDLDYLINEILTECYYIDDGDMDVKYLDEITDHVTNRVAPDLYEMCKDTDPSDIWIVNDCGDEITIARTKGYRCIGTRYYDKVSKAYNDQIEFENRHFRKNRRRMYDSKSFEKHPDFAKY